MKKNTKKNMNKNDNGMGELLDVLKAHPELVHALVFDHRKVRRLLKGKAARRLLPGVDTSTIQKRVEGARGGGPVALCLRGTAHLLGAKCPKGTRCPQGTRAHRGEVFWDCYGGTIK